MSWRKIRIPFEELSEVITTEGRSPPPPPTEFERILDEVSPEPYKDLGRFRDRAEYTEKVSWMQLSENNLEIFMGFLKHISKSADLNILEIGAGLGKLAECVKIAAEFRGIPMKYKATGLPGPTARNGPGVEMTAALAAVRVYCGDPTPPNVLVNIWPTFDEIWMEALVSFRKFAQAQKRTVWYILCAEERDGCCGTPVLFDELKNWDKITGDVEMPEGISAEYFDCWDNLHDNLKLYRYVPADE